MLSKVVDVAHPQLEALDDEQCTQRTARQRKSGGYSRTRVAAPDVGLDVGHGPPGREVRRDAWRQRADDGQVRESLGRECASTRKE